MDENRIIVERISGRSGAPFAPIASRCKGWLKVKDPAHPACSRVAL